jgi:hypothetical protein
MFPRAIKKTHEVRFFLNHLRTDDLVLDAVEYFLSAMLNAGKAVTYVLRAELPKSHKYDDIYAPWRSGLTSRDRDLFDLLQKLRDLEVHSKSGAEVVSTIKMRPALEMRRSGQNTPIVAQYLALGIYNSEVTIGVPSYLFQVDRTAGEEAKDLFERVNAGGPINILEAGGRYAAMLESLVGRFVEAFGAGATGSLG